MTPFATLAARPGIGCIYYFDVSTDFGATFTLRYSTAWWSEAAGALGESDPRISDIGTLTRALAVDRGFAASTLTVTLENHDGGVDWISNRATFATSTVPSVWRLYCLLFDPAQGLNDYDVKQLGEYTLSEPPTRRNETITISLCDAAMSGAVNPAALPTIRDWLSITDAARPFTAAEFQSPTSGAAYPIDAPIPLMFGYEILPAQRAARNCYIICAVPGDPAGLPSDIHEVRLGNGTSMPQTITTTWGPYGDQTVWTVQRTPIITKNGKDWHILWMDLDLTCRNYGYDATVDHGETALIVSLLTSLGYPAATDPAFAVGGFGYQIHDAIGPVGIVASLLSHNQDNLVTFGTPAATVVEDLLTTCLPTAITVHGAAATNAIRSHSYAAGIIDTGSAAPANSSGFFDALSGPVVVAIRQLCQVGQFDVFFRWDGSAEISALSSDVASQSTSLATLDETLIKDIVERIPGPGERNAPVNRTYVTVDGTRYGPVDDADSIAAWGRAISRDVDGAWLPRRANGNGTGFKVLSANVKYGLYGGRLGNLTNNLTSTWVGPSSTAATVAPPDLSQFAINDTATIRPVLTVTTALNGLSYELCQYIKLTWRRGSIGGPYSSSIFRVEGIRLQPLSAEVTLTLVWCDDVQAANNLPYILDDETNYDVIAASGGRTLLLTDGSSTVTFSSGNLTSDGVVAGDMLIVHDATESATAFKRNRVLRFLTVAATTTTVDQTDFGSGGPFTITDWEIQHGATTTGRAAYYGRTCDGTGSFSNSGYANRLLDG